MKQVTIIGCADGWEDAPEEGECWGITNIILRRKVTAHFDMHNLSWSVQDWYDHYMAWVTNVSTPNQRLARAQRRVAQMPYVFREINKQKVPLYSTHKYKNVPTSVAYPIKDVCSYFKTNYFASTFDYAVAWALYNDYERIDLYGVKMSMGTEYVHQLQSAHRWLGYGMGLGVSVHVHGENNLFKTKNRMLYGYNEKIINAC